MFYEGEFSNGLKNGNGILKEKDSILYSGDFLKDMMHGSGTYTYPSGNTYEGSWKSNKMEGQGVYRWIDSKEYVGEFKDNKMEGKGNLTLKCGTVYQGVWEGGKMEGEFEVRHGGQLVRKDGYKEGKLVNSKFIDKNTGNIRSKDYQQQQEQQDGRFKGGKNAFRDLRGRESEESGFNMKKIGVKSLKVIKIREALTFPKKKIEDQNNGDIGSGIDEKFQENSKYRSQG